MGQMTREQFNQNEQAPTDFLSVDQRTFLAGRDRNSYQGDAKLHVQFFMKPTQNMLRTELEGRPIFDDLEYIEIWIPGDKTNINIRPVQLVDKDRFKAQYQLWKSNQQQETGTPLALAPFLAPSQAEELSFFRIRTVEQLAGVADNLVAQMQGLTLLKQQAQEWLDMQTGSAALLKRIAALEAQVQSSANPPEGKTDTQRGKRKMETVNVKASDIGMLG